MGIGSDMVRGQAALGRGTGGVHKRHVERDRLRDELAVRRDRGTQSRRLLQGSRGERRYLAERNRRAAEVRVGRVGPDAHLRGTVLGGQYFQVYTFFSLHTLVFL